jgi:hypothetical protein
MPKEIINNRYLLPNQVTGEGPQPDTITHLHVGWTPNLGSVQVAALAGGDYANDLERPGYYVDLDRDGINRMIRILRKARDAAFGADA